MAGGRFLAPVFIPLVVVVVSGVVFVVERFRGAPSGRCRVVAHFVSSALLLGAAAAIVASVNPVWSSSGFTDEAMIRSDDLEFYGAYWATLPSMVQCVPRGATIAATELGYLGFTRRDLAIVDPQGLTDRVIAKDAPASLKRAFGVLSTSWRSPRSVIGRRLVDARPVVVLALVEADSPRAALGGRYLLRRTRPLDGGPSIGLYVRSDLSELCGARA